VTRPLIPPLAHEEKKAMSELAPRHRHIQARRRGAALIRSGRHLAETAAALDA